MLTCKAVLTPTIRTSHSATHYCTMGGCQNEGLHRGLGFRDNGKENGNYYSILGLYLGVYGAHEGNIRVYNRVILGDNGKIETTIVYWGYI